MAESKSPLSRANRQPAAAKPTASSKAATGCAGIVPNSGAVVLDGAKAEAGRPHCRRDERPTRGPHRDASRAVSRIPVSPEAKPSRDAGAMRGARRTHEFARSAEQAVRPKPTSPHCQPKRSANTCPPTKLSFTLSKFRLLCQTAVRSIRSSRSRTRRMASQGTSADERRRGNTPLSP